MLNRAQAAGFRAFVSGSLLLITLMVTWCLTVSPAVAAPAAAGAQISIVNGKTTSIDKWPWQVAIVAESKPGKKRSPRSRFFCGGSLITPELVVTAGHCVAGLKPREIRRVEVISGRTRLNDEAQGKVTGVLKAIMPMNRDGSRKYSERSGGAIWDIALLRLDEPLDSPTIRIAGNDEAASWAAGQLARTTGWGVTGNSNRKASNVLRVASQVILPDRVCRHYNGNQFEVATMNCLGGPGANSTTCFGDSGGPLVAPLSGEYRLVGLTSFGDPYCSPNLPSVDARIAGNAMRSWVKTTALAISGVDVIGHGGITATPRTWCRVPDLNRLTVNRARAALTRAGCRLGGIKHTFAFSSREVGRVVGTSFVRGWLAPVGTRVKVWIGR